MAFCSSCGANVGDSSFCYSCGAQVMGAAGTQANNSIPVDNTCVRCGANLQNGVCLSCGWTMPVQTTAPQPPVATPINVTVNAGTAAGGPFGPPCPRCHSQNTVLVSIKRKKLSGGKIAAGVMTGGLSLLATGVSSKQKVDWLCPVCGISFTTKSR